MSKANLQDMMTKRTPLAQRDVVMPANLYTNPQVEKYTTHLRPETIKAIKRLALEQDSKDYEVVQKALDVYLDSANAPRVAQSVD